jgi:tetratricopeptide (TPR) repeat protein
MEHALVEGLREVHGIDVRVFSRPPISDANVKAGHELARKYLRQSGAQILLWGTVITAPGKNVPKLYWTTSGTTNPAKLPGRYPLTENDLNLPVVFISDLAQVLRLLVATQSADFYAEEGRFVADRLAPFIEKVRHLLDAAAGQGWSAKDIALVEFTLGNALETYGEQTGQNPPLQEAVTTYRAALQERTQARVPLDWAMTQNNLGNALMRLGERESGTQHLTEAVTAYRAALQEYTQARVPLDWAMAQTNLGSALRMLGERETGTQHLEEAVAAYKAALQELTRERVPLQWAMTQNNLGSALQTLGERESGTQHLEEAVAAYKAALQERTRQRVPLDWAITQNNLGDVLRMLGTRTRDTNQLCEALADHVNAWRVFVGRAPYYASRATANAKKDLDAVHEASRETAPSCLHNYSAHLNQMGIPN